MKSEADPSQEKVKGTKVAIERETCVKKLGPINCTINDLKLGAMSKI